MKKLLTKKTEEQEGNRQYRRKIDKLERSKKPGSIFLSADWLKKKEMIAKKVANKIAKVKARKAERLAKQEAEGLEIKKADKKKLSPKEQKQIRRRAKIIKFTNKIKNRTI